MSKIVKATNLKKTYYSGVETPVIRGIDLEVEEGEFVAILGESGSGKSTLLYLLSGIEKADEGEVELLGKRLSSVSDAEMQLQTTLDELTSTPEGLQTVNLARGWDQASLSEIGKDPSILATLHEQRMNGVYDFITKEMQHQKMLGNLPDNIPFLQAYKAVGDFCLQQLQQKQQQQQQAVANLPKGTLNQGNNTNNSAQVKSAAPSGRSRKAASTFVDPFSLSDEEFEKQFANYA